MRPTSHAVVPPEFVPHADDGDPRTRAHASMLRLFRTRFSRPNGSLGGMDRPGAVGAAPSETWRMDPLILREHLETFAR